MTPEKILSFWLDETNPKQWYAASKELDGIILREFYATWVSIMDGKFGMWLTYPSGSLCLLYTSPSPRDGLLSRMPSSA